MKQTVSVDCEKPVQTQSHREPSHPNSIHRNAVLATVVGSALEGFCRCPPRQILTQAPRDRWLVRNADSSPIIFILHDPHGELVRVVVSAEVVEAMGLLLSTQGLTFGGWTLASFSFMLHELSTDSEVQAAPCFSSAVILYTTRMHVVSWFYHAEQSLPPESWGWLHPFSHLEFIPSVLCLTCIKF